MRGSDDEEVRFPMSGDASMAFRLRENYERGSLAFRDNFDPTAMNRKGYEDQHKLIVIEGSRYAVIGDEMMEDWPQYYLRYPELFHIMTKVIIFTYDVSSKESFQKLEEKVVQIPPPKDGLITFCSGKLFTPAKSYPIVLIACRYPPDSPRLVDKEDINSFIRQHEGCIFAGECVPDGELGPSINVDEVFRVAIKIYHDIRKRAQPAEAIGKENNHKRGRKKTCVVL